MTKICEEKVKGDSRDDEETGGDVFDPLAPAADPIAHEIDNLKRDNFPDEDVQLPYTSAASSRTGMTE
ncbi:hypothetical protein NFJ02_17g27620 [Pycnococcus provasolii]